MSIGENLEKIWKNVKDISDNLEKKYNRRHVDKIIRILASLILTYIILSKLFNWEVLCSNIKMELWNEALRLMVKKYIYKLCLFWLIYRLLLFRLFKIICINIDKTDKTESLPIVFTIDDIVDFLCSVYFLIYAINELIEYNNGISSMGNMISVIAIGYLFCVYAEWLYVQNSNNWYFVSREYTYYYDANNKRIPKDAYVIYRSEMYKVCLSSKISSERKEIYSKKREWELRSLDNDEQILLKDAVRNTNGGVILIEKM